MQQAGAGLITASIVGLLCLSCHILVIKGNHDNALQQMFADRTRNDWEAAWHVEKHRRCYQELVSHMELVCRHDIYNLMARKRSEMHTSDRHFLPSASGNSKKSTSPTHRKAASKADPHPADNGIFLTAQEASSLWRGRTGSIGRRIKRGGIMDECCSEVGCSWEEYAEYCPTNRRNRLRS